MSKESDSAHWLRSVSRGAKWFNALGGLTILFAALQVLGGVFGFVRGASWGGEPRHTMFWDAADDILRAIVPFVVGWLLLVARDALEALAWLIRERTGAEGTAPGA